MGDTAPALSGPHQYRNTGHQADEDRPRVGSHLPRCRSRSLMKRGPPFKPQLQCQSAAKGMASLAPDLPFKGQGPRPARRFK
jgi:hypothetical protein